MLGRLTVTDSHCFPAACLHWGLIEGTGDDQTYLDPLTLLGGGPVRLLPLWRDDADHGRARPGLPRSSGGGARSTGSPERLAPALDRAAGSVIRTGTDGFGFA